MTTEAINSFWKAWPRLRARLERELAESRYGAGTEELTDLTQAIDPMLEWHLAPGRSAIFALCLSAAADPGLRYITERWYKAGPDADRRWEFHPARIAVEPAPITVGDIGIDPLDVTVHVVPDPASEALDVTIGHPDFSLVDQTLQLQIAFRLLDDLLGEDGTEFWIGAVDAVPHSVPWGFPFAELAEEVELLVATATGKHWEMAPRDDPELGESQVFYNQAMKRLHFLEMVDVVTVSIETSGPKDPLVREVEADLASLLRNEGVIFGHQIFDTFTVIYAYATPKVAETVSELEKRWRPAVYEVFTDHDPAWDTYDDMSSG